MHLISLLKRRKIEGLKFGCLFAKVKMREKIQTRLSEGMEMNLKERTAKKKAKKKQEMNKVIYRAEFKKIKFTAVKVNKRLG